MALTGYALIKGDSARRYLTPTGETISRRAYMQLAEGTTPEAKRAGRAAAGIKSHMGRYQAIADDYRRMNPGAKIRGKDKADFKSVIEGLKSGDRTSRGPLARALERIGRRSSEWRDYYAVGDTPD